MVSLMGDEVTYFTAGLQVERFGRRSVVARNELQVALFGSWEDDL